MIFITGIVPDRFGVGLVHPILKNGKPAHQCAALHIVQSLFQLLFVSYFNPLFLMNLHFDALLWTTSSGSKSTQDGNTFTVFLQIFLLMRIKMVIFSSLEHLMLVEPSILANMALSCSKPFSEVFPLASFPLFTVCITRSQLSSWSPLRPALILLKKCWVSRKAYVKVAKLHHHCLITLSSKHNK